MESTVSILEHAVTQLECGHEDLAVALVERLVEIGKRVQRVTDRAASSVNVTSTHKPADAAANSEPADLEGRRAMSPNQQSPMKIVPFSDATASTAAASAASVIETTMMTRDDEPLEAATTTPAQPLPKPLTRENTSRRMLNNLSAAPLGPPPLRPRAAALWARRLRTLAASGVLWDALSFLVSVYWPFMAPLYVAASAAEVAARPSGPQAYLVVLDALAEVTAFTRRDGMGSSS
jgi:hypothetical protein